MKQVEEEEERVEIKWQKSQQPMAHIHTHTRTHTCMLGKRMRAWGIEKIKCKHSLTRTQIHTRNVC